MGQGCGSMGWTFGAGGLMGQNCRVYGAEMWGWGICGAEL